MPDRSPAPISTRTIVVASHSSVPSDSGPSVGTRYTPTSTERTGYSACAVIERPGSRASRPVRPVR